MKNRIDANLSAMSKESSISIKTVDRPGSVLPMLSIGLDNAHLHDFMQMVPGLPEIAGVLNVKADLVYDSKAFTGTAP